ncbi:SecA [Roseibium sp. TrichSKD4]|uniref:hypothetical protein n=1 Tax=Roseibium sp. TrichSKD4 TaxID=744980 RepID=UPI0001E56656|nr:hypothetical protein [Roseibium sp. TrichSKD4]EFO33568.1 SecA [Roseibium sp. TrichSKD4]
MKTRSDKADALDLKLFNLSRELEEFAKEYRDPQVDEASRKIFGMRTVVRKHMTEEQRNRTS